MRPKTKERKQAITLRLRGRTLPEISKALKVSKSTCYLWLKDLKIPPKGIKCIEQRKQLAQELGRKSAKTKIEARDKAIKATAEKTFKKIKIEKNVGKLLCAVLYWAEGQKKSPSLYFANSDPGMVQTYLSLLREYFDIEESKLYAILHLHGYHNVVKQKIYWSKITGINKTKIYIYKKKNSGKNTRPGYPGCISVRYGDVRLAREIEYLYNNLIRHYGGVG